MRTRHRKRVNSVPTWTISKEFNEAWKRLQKEKPNDYPTAKSPRQRRLPV